MAHEVIFITIAQTLATFNIEKPVVNGVVIHPSVERSEGVVRLVFLSFSFPSVRLLILFYLVVLLRSSTSSNLEAKRR